MDVAPAWEVVRRRVLEEHMRIRALLIQIDAAQRQLAPGRPDALEEVRKQVRHLVAVFRHHLGVEERTLAPLLDPGPAARMREDHHEQRQLLGAVAADVFDERRPLTDVADEVAWFVAALLRDMDREERDLHLSEAAPIASAS
jgi:hemerythrin-like domain-containing protein